MASYTTTAANLLEFAQSRLMTGIDAKRPDRVFVCIPVDVNEIKTSTDNNGKARADARLALWPMRNREAYLTRINAKRMAAGDQPKTLDQMPTHTLQVAHSEEFIMANIKKFGKALVDKVLSTLSPEYAASQALQVHPNCHEPFPRQFLSARSRATHHPCTGTSSTRRSRLHRSRRDRPSRLPCPAAGR